MILIKLMIVNNGGTQFRLLLRASLNKCDTFSVPFSIERHCDLFSIDIIVFLLIQLDEKFNEFFGLCLITLGQVVDKEVFGEIFVKLGRVRSLAGVLDLVDVRDTGLADVFSQLLLLLDFSVEF